MAVLDFYDNEVVFITGATGFLGKYLVYKLLTASKTKCILVMIHKRKETSFEERVQHFWASEIFAHIPKSFTERVNFVQGDAKIENLGLSPTDMNKITSTVTIFIHSAGNINLAAAPMRALEDNFIPIKGVVKVCHAILNLKAFIFVSTSYAFRNQKVLKESINDPPDYVRTILNEDNLAKHEATIRELEKEYCNAYVLSKSLSELYIKENCKDISTIIVRPAMIFPSIKEPFNGWFDGYQVVQLLGLAYAIGMVQVARESWMHGVLPMIPVDVCGNAVLGAAPFMDKKTGQNLFVVNVCLERSELVSLTTILNFQREIFMKYPSINCINIPSPSIMKQRWSLISSLLILMKETIPVRVADVIMAISGKPRTAAKNHKKVRTMLQVVECLKGKNDFFFESDNFLNLWHWMCENDPFFRENDLRLNLDLEQAYLRSRKAFLKEPLDNVAAAKRRFKMIKLLSIVYDWWPAFTVGLGVTGFVCFNRRMSERSDLQILEAFYCPLESIFTLFIQKFKFMGNLTPS